MVLTKLNFIRKFIQGGQFTKHVRIDGKVIIVTGCNTGIGRETVYELAKCGAQVHMACRNVESCEKTRQEIIQLTGNENVYNRELDLASFESIRQFTKKFLKDEKRLDILINNAGVMAMPKQLTNDGFEMQFGVNHLGHFLLTNLLLDTLKASAPSRIIVLSSVAHRFGKINTDDLNSERSYDKFKAYAQSKLANVLFVHELAKRLENTGVTVNAVHPGIVKTNLGRYLRGNRVKQSVNPIKHFFFKTPESGAQTTLALALDPDMKNVNGKYFRDCKLVRESRRAKNDQMAKWLWDISEKWTGLITPSTQPHFQQHQQQPPQKSIFNTIRTGNNNNNNNNNSNTTAVKSIQSDNTIMNVNNNEEPNINNTNNNNNNINLKNKQIINSKTIVPSSSPAIQTV